MPIDGQEFEPGTPLVKKDHKKALDDPNEILLGNDEITEDETNDDE
jgi:hypothetical protein